ncbi:Transposon Tf2-6 polyprotein [Gossypium australe]|uniref:Transposon Tf2-6 polyprotein n=1 Tax=Gossypium australe TaxID=47621 RepID=A0A5B6W5S5_9ROSI|nr:Transposon Tf2-6 polyprotein [Gossypium australe]
MLIVAILTKFEQTSGVSAYPRKIKTVRDWPKPHSTKTLKGFLIFAGSTLNQFTKEEFFPLEYRSYRIIPSTQGYLFCCPVLKLSNFTNTLLEECDTSGRGIKPILQQQRHTTAVFSRKLANHHFKLPTYERELIGLSQGSPKLKTLIVVSCLSHTNISLQPQILVRATVNYFPTTLAQFPKLSTRQ